LISIPLPLNVLNVLLVPVFLAVKDPQKRKRINRAVLMLTFAPIALISTFIFATLNAVLLPFAFAKALLHKVLIVVR
jgi:hypothetical protein